MPSYPGHNLHPDGRMIFVQDNWAYISQHPETYEPTQNFINSFTNTLTRCETFLKEGDAAEAGRRATSQTYLQATGHVFEHYCVGGKVPKDCDECKSSFIKWKQPPTAGKCQKCHDTKLVLEACSQCEELLNDRAQGGVAHTQH